MNSDKNGSFYSDSSQEEDFSFGMEPYDDFESDSDGEADNVVVEVDVRDLQDVNEQFLTEMAWLKVDDDNGAQNEDSLNEHTLSRELDSIWQHRQNKGNDTI